nr:probable E3 ubiquitin-protein ligase RHG1A [Ipomoea batatas]
MDEHSGKRAASGLLVARRGLRDKPNDRDENIQFCPRIGCSGRLNNSRNGCTAKPCSSRQNFSSNSSNGKEVVGSYSRAVTRKLHKDYHRKPASQTKTDQLETRTFRDESVDHGQMESSSTSETGFLSEPRDSEPRKSRVWETGCSSGLSSVTTQQKYCNKSKRANQNNLSGTGVLSTSSNIPSRTRSSRNGVENGYKNPKCNSVSNALPHSSQPRFMKKRSSEGESSSSSVGNRTSRAFSKGGRAPLNNHPFSKEDHSSLNNRGVLISESRCGRSWGPSEDNPAVSVRVRRSNMNSRLRTHDQDTGNTSTHTQPSGLISQLPRPQTPNGHMLSSTYQFSTDTSSSESSPYNLPGNDGNNISSILPFPSAEFGIGQSNNRDALWRYNMDEIAGVLLQLERIEHDDELRYEQLLALETNVFLNGMNFYDQHRDMRLDIDNMSYEELLALGERMGTVSTALSDEAMSKCLRRSIYRVTSLEVGVAGLKGDEDDNKCSICQEEYVLGDEMGMLGCEHGYHLACVHKWLRMKNWCPICKASAVPSRPSSPL